MISLMPQYIMQTHARLEFQMSIPVALFCSSYNICEAIVCYPR